MPGGVLLVWIKVGQGPTAWVEVVSLFVFSHLSALTSLSLSVEDDPIQTEILS